MLSIIVAVGNDNAIGKDNNLLWHIPDDLKRFKRITDGKIIIMGRKTFESLPRVLPNRFHVVITRDESFEVEHEDVKVIHSVEEIKPYINSEEEAFIIGGGEIYNLLMPYAQKLYLTRVYKSYEADTFFPNLEMDEWEVICCESHEDNEELKYEYIDLTRKN